MPSIFRTVKVMWKYNSIEVDNRTLKYTIQSDGNDLTVSEVIDLWIENSEFRKFYNSILEEGPFDAFFWEHPPYSEGIRDEKYEFVLVESRYLDQMGVNSSPFQEYFRTDDIVVSFPNLGGDATLIAPTPEKSKKSIYKHLGSFAREADEKQIEAFWKLVGSECKKVLKGSKYWLSTAGMGVLWLHVRLDSRPKYYRHSPYKQSININ